MPSENLTGLLDALERARRVQRDLGNLNAGRLGRALDDVESFAVALEAEADQNAALLNKSPESEEE